MTATLLSYNLSSASNSANEYMQKRSVVPLVIQGVYQPGKLRENELTQGNHGKLRENDKDSGKIMNIATFS